MPYSKTASASATRAVLEEFGLTAKYALGQNFLVNDGVVGKIVDLAQLDPSDVVLEVGPGIGTLTTALLPHVAAVASIEADADMAGPLSLTTADYSERFALVPGDALRVKPARVQEALAALAAANPQVAESLAGRTLPNKWVANLPYAVAATLILDYFENWPFIQDATVMVQSEVADRICAQPGSKIYGAYTVKLSLFARVAGRFQVPPQCFFPAPHVESAVVRLERLPESERMPVQEAARVVEVVDAAFAQRRKTISNSMSAAKLWTKAQLAAAFAAVGIDPGCRAETLTLAQFKALAAALADAPAASPDLAADVCPGLSDTPGQPAAPTPAKRRKQGKSARQAALGFDPDAV